MGARAAHEGEPTEVFCVGFVCSVQPVFPWRVPGPRATAGVRGGGQHSGLRGRRPLLQMDGASGLLIPILICFADQIPGTGGWGRKGWEQCRGPGAQPQSRGFVHSYEENTKCINLSIYLHVFLKGSLPEIYPLGKMLLVAGRHQLLYVKNKEKRKKKKENVFKKVIYFLLLLLFYFFKLCSKPIFSLGPSIKIAAASFLYGLCDTGENVSCRGARLTGSGAVCPEGTACSLWSPLPTSSCPQVLH